MYKQYCNNGITPSLYFWRDQNGRHEIDCILDEGVHLYPLEIKSGTTLNSHFFEGLVNWHELTGYPLDQGLVVYGGSGRQQRRTGQVFGWDAAGSIITHVLKL